MLLEYRFSNFRSFKEITSLSMMAGRQTTLNDNLIRAFDLRILPSAVIYGANASGKSNAIMSLAIMKDLVLSDSLEASLPNLKNLELYPFAHQETEKTMSFEIDFIFAGKRIQYGFEIEVSTFKKEIQRIVSESLTHIDKSGKKTLLYLRNHNRVEINKEKRHYN